MNRMGEGLLVTGCTGFVGKVVLAELIRRREELGIGTVYVLIRPKRGRSPEERFEREIAGSDCFRRLPADWTAMVRPVAGDLAAPGLGLSVEDRERLAPSIQRIVHCAASVEFDLPLAEAAEANITGALNVLEFARECPGLQAMVDVSTAYVSAHSGGLQAFDERLAPLPVSAADAYQRILEGTAHEARLLEATGHANTYTLTKCIAEHLLVERHGSVPLTIVRPSIISACRSMPFPGWIDSKAAFAGFVALYGMGYLRVMGVDPEVQLDIVPCDEVAERAIAAAFDPPAPDDVRIRYAVAGLERALTVREICALNVAYFDQFPAGRRAALAHVGPAGPWLTALELLYHRLPLWLALAGAILTGQSRQAKAIQRLLRGLLYLNRGFRYFTHRTFDFRSAHQVPDPEFDASAYFRTVARGIHRHLLRQGEEQVNLAGKRHRDGRSDLLWALGQPHGNAAHRLLGYWLRQAFRRGADAVTVDKASFAAAMAHARPDELLVVVPSHRSYADFLICPYLCFAWPDLGLPLPHIAATEDFARLPVLGGLLRWAQAFYIKRGVGRADPELTRRVAALVERRQALTFFIEGTRSRSGRFLPPRRGLLRALQSTGQSCRILPVMISYDRLPEEAAFMRELRGGAAPAPRLGPIVAWLRRLWRGEVQLGRIHVACGQPIRLTPEADVHAVSRDVMAELQAASVASGYHLRAFLAAHPETGLDLLTFSRLLEARGTRIVASDLPLEAAPDPLQERCWRHLWQHALYPDAMRLMPDHPVIRDHIRRHAYRLDETPETPVPAALLRALFEPVCRDYESVARHLASRADQDLAVRVTDLLPAMPMAFRPEVEGALEDLVRRGILIAEDGVHAWGPHAERIAAYAAACPWPDEPSPVPPVAALSTVG